MRRRVALGFFCLTALAGGAPPSGRAAAPGGTSRAGGSSVTLLWTQPLAAQGRPDAVHTSAGPGVLLRAPGGREARLVELATGGVRWRLGAPPGAAWARQSIGRTRAVLGTGGARERLVLVGLEDGVATWDRTHDGLVAFGRDGESLVVAESCRVRLLDLATGRAGARTLDGLSTWITYEDGCVHECANVPRPVGSSGDQTVVLFRDALEALDVARDRTVWRAPLGLTGAAWLDRAGVILGDDPGGQPAVVRVELASGRIGWRTVVPVGRGCARAVREATLATGETRILVTGCGRTAAVEGRGGQLLWNVETGGAAVLLSTELGAAPGVVIAGPGGPPRELLWLTPSGRRAGRAPVPPDHTAVLREAGLVVEGPGGVTLLGRGGRRRWHVALPVFSVDEAGGALVALARDGATSRVVLDPASGRVLGRFDAAEVLAGTRVGRRAVVLAVVDPERREVRGLRVAW